MNTINTIMRVRCEFIEQKANNKAWFLVVSNWVRYPVFVIARDPERFRVKHMKTVLQFLEDNSEQFPVI